MNRLVQTTAILARAKIEVLANRTVHCESFCLASLIEAAGDGKRRRDRRFVRELDNAGGRRAARLMVPNKPECDDYRRTPTL
ncbi:MAG: hypothetical protein ACREC9_03320 [Methylocella sp.]